MGYGDEVIAAGQAQRLWDSDPTGHRIGIFDRDRRPRWHPIWDANPIIATPEEIAAGEPVRALVNGPHCRPYIVYPFTAESGWTFDYSFRAREHVAKIYLTDAERALGRVIREQVGPFVLIDPWSKHQNLRWPLKHWETLVRRLPHVAFVQHVWGDAPIVDGLAAAVHTASFRDACGVLASASAYVRGESGMLHAAAALGVSSVAIWGGCMAWDVMGGYSTQVAVGVKHPVCGRYLPCEHCAIVMGKIAVEEVIGGLRRIGVE